MQGTKMNKRIREVLYSSDSVEWFTPPYIFEEYSA
jgi:hypothetical protein